MNPIARTQSAPRDAVTVAVEICASALNLLLKAIVAGGEPKLDKLSEPR